jgi:hypothetical protein
VGRQEGNVSKRAVLVVETDPVEGREEEWASWYDGVHIPEILERVPGFKGATRFRRPVSGPGASADFGYLTIYEIESDDPGASLDALLAAVQGGGLTRSDTSSGRAKMTLWAEDKPRVTGA